MGRAQMLTVVTMRTTIAILLAIMVRWRRPRTAVDLFLARTISHIGAMAQREQRRCVRAVLDRSQDGPCDHCAHYPQCVAGPVLIVDYRLCLQRPFHLGTFRPEIMSSSM